MERIAKHPWASLPSRGATAALALGVGVAILAAAGPAVAAPASPRPPAFEIVGSPALPAGSTLTAIAAGPDGRAWAVGATPGADLADVDAQAIIEYFDGRRWGLEPLPELPPINDNPVTETVLTGVSIAQDGTVFATGWQQAGDASRVRPLTLRRDRAGWTALPVADDLNSRISYWPQAVSALDARHVWIVGYEVYHRPSAWVDAWDGAAWTGPEAPQITSKSDSLTGVVTLAADDVWVAGTARVSAATGQSRATAFHWDGIAWTEATLPTTGEVPAEEPPTWVLTRASGIAATGGDDVWLWGESTIERYDGTGWTVGPALPTAAATLDIAEIVPTGRNRALVAGTLPAGEVADGRTTASVWSWRHNRWTELRLPASVSSAHTASIAVAAGRGRQPSWLLVNSAGDPAGQTEARIFRSRPNTGLRN